MSKKFLTLGILLVILAGGVIAPVDVSAAAGDACTTSSGGAGIVAGDDVNGLSCVGTNTSLGRLTAPTGDTIDPAAQSNGNFLVQAFAKFIGLQLMTVSAAILGLVGYLFDFVVDHTIVKMATNIGDPTGVGGSITSAWETLRDIANMFFIFVLLFTAFKAMFELNFANVGKAITNIIIIALLINFSLFFSKVVIDASNIVAVGFYKSITSSNTASTGGVAPTGNQSISSGYMKLLGLQSFYSPAILQSKMEGGQLLVVGILGSVFMLVTAVILLISAIMFIARFIILIFLMILSPLALIAFIVPAMESHFTKWWKALVDQAFFAPLFFALTWVVFKVASAPKFLGDGSSILAAQGSVFTDIATKAPTPSSMALVLNYVLVIGFSIAALVFSKTMASSSSGITGFDKLTNAMGANKVAGVVGGVSLGGAAAVGRRTVGAAASRLAESQGLSRWAARSAFGQKVKEGIEKTSKSSFDIRQTKAIGGALQSTPMGSFGAGKAGGYDATLQAQIAKKEKVAQGLKTDQARQTYAARQLRGLSSYARGGSAPGHIWSIAGTMGRSNRIVASKILNDQITKLRTDLNAGNTELTRYQNILNSNGGTGVLNATQQARYNDLTASAIGTPGGVANSLTDLQLQITNIQGQINTLGIINPTNTTRSGRPLRADEQNY